MARTTPTAERSVLAALALVTAAVVVLNDPGVLTPDTKPEVFLAPWRTLERTVAAWQDSPFLGAPNFNVGLAPVTVVTGLLDLAGLPAWLVLRVWRLALLLAAAAGARRLYADLTAGTSAATAPGRVAVAVAYVANPYLLLGGATTPTLLPYALLPWFLLLLRRAFARPGSWAAPAGAALVFAGMSGINAGVVPLLQLVAVLPVALDARVREGRPWRHLVGAGLRTAVLMLVLSLYWLVPALSALGVGSAIAGTTESTSTIAAVSSYAEVLRGLGLWTLYGADAAGPFLPGLLSYLGSPAVILASFAVPVLAALGSLLSRSPARLPAVGLVLVSAPLMVGLFPPSAPSPLGRAMEAAFEHLPGAVAFRTTNKAGAVLVLGLALLVGLGAAAAAHRVRAPGPRWTAGLAAAAVAVGATAPAWTGELYGTRVDVPAYWQEATAALDGDPPDTGGQASRVLLAPGAALARYRWGYVGPDELGNSLLERPTAYRSAVPAGTPYAANLLAGTDLRLQDGDLPPRALSTLARYLGAGDVLVRGDTVWELTEGARPAAVSAAAVADPGLRRLAGYGSPGEQTVGPRGAGAGDDQLQPLQRFAVVNPRGPVRQVRAAGAVLLDGDGEALPDLASRGLLAGDPALLLAGSLDEAALARALDQGVRLVLTDTNGRRAWNLQRLGNGTGPLLAAGEDPTPSRALFAPEHQTVAVDTGTASVTQSGRGLIFGPVPFGAPRLAADRDPSTAWLTGNFGGGVGDALTVRNRTVVAVPRVSIRLPEGQGRRVTAVRVTVTGGAREAAREQAVADGPGVATVVELGDARGDAVRVEIASVGGQGFGPVGLAEVTVPGMTVTPAARLPVRLSERLAALAGPQRPALDRTPVDVLLRRRAGTPGTATDDEEPRLLRDLTLPVTRTLRVRGHLRISGSIPDRALDRLAGQLGPVSAAASSRPRDDPAARGTAAVDVRRAGGPDLDTAWRPADPTIGQWLEVRFPRRVVRGITITQDDGPGAGVVRRARVSVDGRPGLDVDLGAGATRVPLPPGPASRVRITLLDRTGAGPVRVRDVSVQGVPPSARPPAARGATAGCVTVALLDGRPLSVRPSRGPAALATGAPSAFESCTGEPLRLRAGPHTLRGVADWAVDDLWLQDVTTASTGATSAPASLPVEVLDAGDTGKRLRTSAAGRPYYVVAGTGLDPGWSATADGVDLGPPVLVDGYSAGWLVADGAAHTVEIGYRPAGRSTLAGALSLAGSVGCLALVARSAVRRRRAGRAVQEEEVSGVSSQADDLRVVTGSGRVAAWAAVVLAAWVAGGAVLAGAAVALTAWHLVRPPAPAVLLGLATALLAVVPVAWIVGNGERLGPATADLVLANPFPGQLAAVAVLLLAVGVARDVLVRRGSPA